MKTVRLTKTMLDSVDPSHMAMDIRQDDPKAGMSLSFALSTVESYLAEAAVQERRIVREQKAIREYMRQTQEAIRSGQDWRLRRRHRANAFRSVHFYLTCWRMIGRHLDLIADASRLQEVKTAIRPHRRTLKEYKDMRDLYEHFDELLPGREHLRRGRRPLSKPNDLGNFIGYTLSFGGQRIDIGPKSLELLRRIVSEVLTAFKLGALRKMTSANPRIIEGWFTPLRIKYLQRYVKRQMTKAASRREQTTP